MSFSTTTISSCTVHDVRFPTSLTGDGSDAMNTECDYSAAYVILHTNPPLNGPDGKLLEGHGMTFTIGRGNEIVCNAIELIFKRLLVGKDTETLFADMGKTFYMLTGDSQLRWIGPEKGVIALATSAIVNGLFDLFAKTRNKPLWKLLSDFTPEEFVKLIPFKYITDFITPEEALELLKSRAATKKAREDKVGRVGYPAYTTSVGWIGYSDEKVVRLTKEAIQQGFTHFKLKVGAGPESDRTRVGLVKKIISDPANFPENYIRPREDTLVGKNATQTGCVLMVDANQVWSVPEAINYMKTHIVEFEPWFIEEPTAPDDALGHANIRQNLVDIPNPKATNGTGKTTIGVATGEHAHNRMTFKQLLQAKAIDVVQIDSCRMGGVNEVLAVLLMAAKAGVPVCPHAGGVGLCELVIHLSLIDYLSVSGPDLSEQDAKDDSPLPIPNVLEYVEHLHEHFVYPIKMSQKGTYLLPDENGCGYSIELKPETFGVWTWPNGSYWKGDDHEAAKSLYKHH